MSSSATDDATASTDGPEKQVKFSLPGRSNISSSGKNKVFSRSCSSAGVLGSLSKQQQTSLKSSSDSNASTSTSKSQHGGSGSGKNNATSSSGLSNIPEDKQTEQEEVDDAAARAKAKRASMVKKALRYFEDKSNRSMSEDNLFTRRKNLAVHLGLDENVSLREIQKINTFSLPVPSSATGFNAATGPLGPRDIVVVEEEEEEVDVEEDVKTKDLVRFLGMKDGVTASMASQGVLSDDCTPPVVNNKQEPQFPKPLAGAQATSAISATASGQAAANIAANLAASAAASGRSSSIGSTPLDRIIQKQSSTDKKNS